MELPSSNIARPTGFSSVALIAVSMLFFLLAWFFDLEEEQRLLALVFGSITALVFVLFYKQLLLMILAFLVPVSIQLKVGGGAEIGFPSEIIAALLAGFFIAKFILGYRPAREFLKHPVTLLMIADLSWLFISSCMSEMPAVSFKRLIMRLIYYIAFYYFYFELFRIDQKNIRRVIYIQLTALLIPIGYTLARHASMEFVMIGSQQISRPFYFDHTIYGAVMVFYIPFLLGEVASQKKAGKKILLSLLTIVILFAAVFSFSRAAWLSLLVALSIYTIIALRIQKFWLYVFACVVIVVSGFNLDRVNGMFAGNKEESHTKDLSMHIKSVSNISTDASNKERINRWKCAVRMFADKPVFGFGPGTYQFFYGPYQLRSELTRISTFSGNKGHAHSEYLNYLSETGLPGLLVFLGLIGAIIYAAIKQIKLRNKNVLLLLGLLCGLITYFVHGFFNGFLEFDKMALPVLSSIAAISFMDLHPESNEIQT